MIWVLLFLALLPFALAWFLRCSKWGHVWSCRRFGLCPLCDSSPPRPHCPVCRGAYDYGPQLPEPRRQQWIDRYLMLREK